MARGKWKVEIGKPSVLFCYFLSWRFSVHVLVLVLLHLHFHILCTLMVMIVFAFVFAFSPIWFGFSFLFCQRLNKCWYTNKKMLEMYSLDSSVPLFRIPRFPSLHFLVFHSCFVASCVFFSLSLTLPAI